MVVEEYLGKGRKLYAAFVDLEQACDRADRKALWGVLTVCGIGGGGYRKEFNLYIDEKMHV